MDDDDDEARQAGRQPQAAGTLEVLTEGLATALWPAGV
jgi:hypothetical protein